MFRHNSILLLCLGLLVAGCSETLAPVDDGAFSAKKSKSSGFFSGYSFETATISGGEPTGISSADAPANTLEQSSEAPLLQTYSTAFTHVQGETTIFSLNYKGESGWTEPFLFLVIPPDAEVLDDRGKPVRKGKSVEITVEIDMVKFLVHFGPHGSTFLGRRPATIWFQYKHADQSGQDPNSMTMWYQPAVGEAWTMLDTQIDTFGSWARAEIDHFSNYAVAW